MIGFIRHFLILSKLLFGFIFFISKRETKREREERELRERLEADRLAEQQALLSQQQSPYEPQSDSKLEEYVNAVTDEIHPLPTTKEQVIGLAQ